MSEGDMADRIRKIGGIVCVKELTEEEKEEVLRLECESEKGVLMGLCQGINVGVREALKRKKVYACATDRSFVWPNYTYIKITCGDELIGEDINDKERIERLKCEGHLIAGTLVFYRDKMRLFKERRDETKVYILPLEIQDVHGKFVVGSPSPPTDVYLKKRMCIDTENKDLGTILIGAD